MAQVTHPGRPCGGGDEDHRHRRRGPGGANC